MPTSRTDTPERRRLAAEETLAALPAPDVSIWTDGSAGGGISDGGGGALLVYHHDHVTTQLTTAAGRVCSSTRAELVAIHEALVELSKLPVHPPRRLLLCCDSQAAIEAISGAADSQSLLVRRIEERMTDISAAGHQLQLQWVPGHAGLPGNEEADRLAAIGSRRPQATVPIDLQSARLAVARRARDMCAARARAAHPHPGPTPGHEELDRRTAEPASPSPSCGWAARPSPATPAAASA